MKLNATRAMSGEDMEQIKTAVAECLAVITAAMVRCEPENLGPGPRHAQAVAMLAQVLITEQPEGAKPSHMITGLGMGIGVFLGAHDAQDAVEAVVQGFVLNVMRGAQEGDALHRAGFMRPQ